MTKNRLNAENKYFVVNLEWFLQWKCYVINDLSDKYLTNNKKRISSNKQIGVLPPGPIQNICLFDRNVTEFNEKTLKKGLKKVIFFNTYLERGLYYHFRKCLAVFNI